MNRLVEWAKQRFNQGKAQINLHETMSDTIDKVILFY